MIWPCGPGVIPSHGQMGTAVRLQSPVTVTVTSGHIATEQCHRAETVTVMVH